MSAETQFDKESILKFLVETLNDMTSDWDTDHEGAISEDTRLIEELEFESIDVVQLIVAIEEHFQRHDLNFEKLLMKDAHFVDEFRVGEIRDVLYNSLNGKSG